MNKKFLKILAGTTCAVCLVASLGLSGCGSTKDSIVIMTEALSGLFNPFYATSGTDQDVVGMTQISMLSTDSEGKMVAGEDYATVVLDYDITYGSNTSVYTFVIKNGLKFSDGEPLTMEDILFNMYEYLDPVYTGSSTMYSTDIVGLSQYRTQTNYSSGNDSYETELSETAATRASARIQELVDAYEYYAKQGSSSNVSYYITMDDFKSRIRSSWTVTAGYKNAVSTSDEQATLTNSDYREMMVEDIDYVLETFADELESDYQAAQESYDTDTLPYSQWTTELSSEVFRFFLYEGYITPEYGYGSDNKKDKTNITSFQNTSYATIYSTKTAAIEKVYTDTTVSSFNSILTGWGTAGTVQTQFAADALDILLHENLEDGELVYKNISGIVSLGHTTGETSVTVNKKTYTVAQAHNEDGTPQNEGEYDVLQITINGVDPKAIYNFGFTVAPAHYYGSATGDGSDVDIDIVNNKFGVEWSTSSFQTGVIQSQTHNEVPVGAGAFQATDSNNNDNPSGTAFWANNIVYYKKNDYFMFDVKAEKIQMQVVSSTDALSVLKKGEVDYVTPQFTKDVSNELNSMVQGGGYESLDAWNLGYGYIGINAGKVANVYLRRAIMSAMQTSLATDYYYTGTCRTISWPMSTVSWAYPWEDDEKTIEKSNGHSYTQWTTRSAAVSKVQEYMDLAGVSAGDSELSITFTIAGSSISEHPTYQVFTQAAEILNECGWDIEVKADSQALTKLSTGSLEVWAAAWGSTVDPDMYQVYHMNSTATSTYAWGYREIKANKTLYSYEYNILVQLSELIDDARETNDETVRSELYEEAMSYVLDLAVELPVYQRKNLYAYNSKTISGINSDINPYSSPLERIWELELIA